MDANFIVLQVVGFESAWKMAKGQAGVGHAVRICQCNAAEIKMKRALPVQVPTSLSVIPCES